MSTKFNADLILVSARTKVSDTEFLHDFFACLGFLDLSLRPDGCFIPLDSDSFKRFDAPSTFADDATFAMLENGYVKFRNNEGWSYKLFLSDLVNALILLPFVRVETFDVLYNAPELADWKDYYRLLQLALFSEFRYEV